MLTNSSKLNNLFKVQSREGAVLALTGQRHKVSHETEQQRPRSILSSDYRPTTFHSSYTDVVVFIICEANLIYWLFPYVHSILITTHLPLISPLKFGTKIFKIKFYMKQFILNQYAVSNVFSSRRRLIISTIYLYILLIALSYDQKYSLSVFWEVSLQMTFTSFISSGCESEIATNVRVSLSKL